MPPAHLPGDYHPRVWRNGWTYTQRCPTRAEYRNYPRDLAQPRRAAAVSARRILNMLADTFEHIEPAVRNQDAFGPSLRHLIILACAEVEAAWRGVLAANEYPHLQKPVAFASTRDYVKLRDPMRQDEYRYNLALYEDVWTDQIAPFAGWTHANASGSLSWYDAYNAAKHYRENAHSRANLRAVINAAAAVVTMLYAQFGANAPEVQAVLEHPAGFHAVGIPKWLPEELYFPADEHGFCRKSLAFPRT